MSSVAWGYGVDDAYFTEHPDASFVGLPLIVLRGHRLLNPQEHQMTTAGEATP
ncbi:MAG: hypothetical protein WA880_14480 [Ornithinimicrobium sp.]